MRWCVEDNNDTGAEAEMVVKKKNIAWETEKERFPVDEYNSGGFRRPVFQILVWCSAKWPVRTTTGINFRGLQGLSP